MNVDLTEQDLAFREEVRAFIRDKYPADIREKMDQGIALEPDELVRWQKILYEQGWIAVNWPEEFGGTGWDIVKQYIFAGELAAVNAPNIIPFGVKNGRPHCLHLWQ